MQVFIYSQQSKQKDLSRIRDTRKAYTISTLRTRPHDTHTHKPKRKEKGDFPFVLVPAGPLVRALSWQKWRPTSAAAHTPSSNLSLRTLLEQPLERSVEQPVFTNPLRCFHNTRVDPQPHSPLRRPRTRTLAAARPLSTLSLFTLSSHSSFPL